MANHLNTLQLEFYRKGSDTPAVIGTDCIMHIDGRLTLANATAEIEEMAANFIEVHPELEWRGTVYLLGGRYASKKVS